MGVTRSGLFRLIVAESLLIGVVACVLSLGFGAMAGYCGTGVTRYINIRGGQFTPLVIPWARLMVGFAMAMGLCLLASALAGVPDRADRAVAPPPSRPRRDLTRPIPPISVSLDMPREDPDSPQATRSTEP